MKKLAFISIILSMLIMSACANSERKLISRGIWPFVDKVLWYKRFDVKKGIVNEFVVKRCPRKDLYVDLYIYSKEETAFFEIDTSASLEFIDKSNNIMLSNKGPLNAHYVRMKSAGESLYLKPQEWNTYYFYHDPKIRRKAIPFDPSVDPLKVTSIRYSTFLRGCKPGKVSIIFGDGEREISGLVAQLSFNSPWKDRSIYQYINEPDPASEF